MADIACDSDGNLYMLSSDSRLFLVNSKYELIREITVTDGSGEAVDYSGAKGLYLSDKDSLIYIADTSNSRVIAINADGKIVRSLETPDASVIPDDFQFIPFAMSMDSKGVLYVDESLRRTGRGPIFCDKNGKMYMLTYTGYILPDGTLGSKRLCVHILISEDFGKDWYYLSTIPYLEEYNNPNCIDIEGFNETSLLFAEDGDIFAIMRSGSLHPFKKGDADHPAPKQYCARSSDGGKTWKAEPFYDFGILPQTVKLECGTTILVSGRPGVYVRSTDDPKFREWREPEFLVKVPEDEVYGEYYEYTCSNTGICAYDSNTAFITYSNFKLTAPDGKRAKSILVQKVTVE